MNLICNGQVNWTITEKEEEQPEHRFSWIVYRGEDEALVTRGYARTESEARADVARFIAQRVVEW